MALMWSAFDDEDDDNEEEEEDEEDELYFNLGGVQKLVTRFESNERTTFRNHLKFFRASSRERGVCDEFTKRWGRGMSLMLPSLKVSEALQVPSCAGHK